MSCHHGDSLSEQEELFSCLTRAVHQGEGDSLCVSSGAQKPTDDGWSTPSGSLPMQLELPSSEQSSWKPFTHASTAQRSWAFRSHVQEPPYEPVRLKPVIPEVIHLMKYGSTPQWLLLPRSDSEILTLFNDDTSSIRDDYTAWVTANSNYHTRPSHIQSNAAPVFPAAFEKACLSSPSEYNFDISQA